MNNVLRAGAVTAFVSCVALSRAQQPFPTSADNGTWNVLHCLLGIDITCFTETFTYDASETFCGHTWSVYTWPTFGFPGIAYIRNEGQRTLLRRTTDCLDKEYLVYDFSMEVGDTVYAALNMDLLPVDTAMFVLQSIDTVEQFGIERRRFRMLYDPCGSGAANTQMDWIEGIGSAAHPFYPVDCMCGLCEQEFTVLCYDSTGVQLYASPFFNTCDTLITGIETQAGTQANVQIIYDPIADVILIVDPDGLGARSSALSIMLVASDGRVVKQQGVSASISNSVRMDVAGIAPGAYIVSLTDGRTRLAGQRVVIH